MIDLRSDTVTRPTPGMLEAMFKAEVGDDVFGEDPTVKALEEKTAALFRMEAGLFVPSGTMSNQIAVKVHTRPMDEVLCDRSAHVYNYEAGGMAFNSGCSVRYVEGDRGRLQPEQIPLNINPDDQHFPRTRLVVVENTSNRGGGSVYDLEWMRALSETARSHGLKIHLDGARLFNALVALDTDPEAIKGLFDSISICLSKGLGAPVGSVLLGPADFIREARRVRKVLGGAMRQAGYLAAAGIYALDHHVERLAEDHRLASKLGQFLAGLPYVEEVMPVETNIVVCRLCDSMAPEKFLRQLEQHGIRAIGFGPQLVRFVTHLDVNEDQMNRVIRVLEKDIG